MVGPGKNKNKLMDTGCFVLNIPLNDNFRVLQHDMYVFSFAYSLVL